LSQETAKPPSVEVSATPQPKKPITLQELVDSLRGTADDIGQISELSSEEKILVSQFFTSLLKLMQPLAPSIQVTPASLPAQVGDVTTAYIDPTGHLVLQYTDGHIELKNLSDEKNRELMMSVVGDVVPKFKALTTNQKRKLENRIKLLSSVTKEIQKSSDALSAALSAGNNNQ
jgi:hypothetical protein